MRSFVSIAALHQATEPKAAATPPNFFPWGQSSSISVSNNGDGKVTIVLDGKQFDTEELERFAEQVLPALQKKLAAKSALEVRQRIEKLVAKIEQLTPESLRRIRALEVLEHIGDSEAKKVLETLAAGAEGAKLTEEAKASLARLNRRAVAEK